MANLRSKATEYKDMVSEYEDWDTSSVSDLFNTMENYEKKTRNLELLYKKTRNPIFAIMAIKLSLTLSNERRDHKRSSETNKSHWTHIPFWCLDFIGHAASEIEDLANGFDIREKPKMKNFRIAESYYGAFRVWKKSPTLSPKEAMKHVARSLKLLEGKQNEIQRYRRFKNLIRTKDQFQALEDQGIKPTKAYSIISENRGLSIREVIRLVVEGLELFRFVPRNAMDDFW